MGAFTVALGLPSLVLQPLCTRNFSRIPRLSHNFSTHTNAHKFSHSHFPVAKNLRQFHGGSRRIIDLACAASASWPYESWGADEDQAVRSNRPGWSAFLEQEGGFEALAMGLGVVVSVALAFSKQGAAGVSVGILSLAFLTATTVALRQQIASLVRMLVAHFNSVQTAMAVQLSSIRNNVMIWGARNGTSVSSATVLIESASFPGRQENIQDENFSSGSKGLSSAEIEAALSNIAKSVAQLTMVVANLDNKITSLEIAASNNVSSFRSPTSELEGVTTGPAFTDVEERQIGTYRIRNSVVNGSGTTQLKWEEAVVKERRANQLKPQVLEGYEPSEYDSKALPSTILYDSRGDRVLLLESSPIDATVEVGSIGVTLSQSAPSKFSKAQTGDSSIELFFQEVRVRAPQEDGVTQYEYQIQSKQDNAAVEPTGLFFQDAGFRAPEADGEKLQSKQRIAAVAAVPTARNPVESVAQPELSNSTLASPVPSGAEDNRSFRNKTAPRRGRVYNEADALREETSGRRASREAINRSSEYELDGSEGYRAVPTTLGTASKPDVLRLKRIMSGAEPSAMFTDEATPKLHRRIQNDPMVSETSRSKVLKPAEVLEVGATQSSASWDEYPVFRSTGYSRSDEYGGVNDPVGVDRGATRPQGVQDVLSYDGQERSPGGRPRPEGSEGTKSSSRADYGQRWPREGSSDATDADFGGNGSSSDTNEGENGSKRRQGSSRSSGIENDSDEDRDVEPPTSQGRRPSRASPSYPSQRTETFRNLPEPKSDDEGFQKILDEVDALLKEGREGLEGRIEVGVAERMLYEAAELCEKAVEVRPSSLIAVGLWGNTLLLHGELKLRLSQNLRSMLPEAPSKSLKKRELKEAEEERQSLESTLQDVGEECEQLLVEAGRKYRLALSMDRTDMRALYNWGLALCYRGQLIAEEGGETAAQDADKVFLAAIDKFEAMIGLSDTYAAGALLNWGLAMRDRSRLRPMGSKERRKILAQAKEIFQEALRLDPNYGQARGAVAACIVELKGLEEYNEEEPKKPKDPSTSRGFRDWWG